MKCVPHSGSLPRFLSSLRLRLLLLVLLALIPSLLLTVYSGMEQRYLATQQAEKEALRLARLAANRDEQLFEGAHHLLSVLATLPVIQNYEDPACSQFLAGLLKHYPHYFQFGVARRDGLVMCTAKPDPAPVDDSGNPYFERVLATRAFALGDFRIGRLSGKPSIGFGYPLFDSNNQIEAVVFAAMDLAPLNELAAQSLMPGGTTLTAIDHSGIILARYPDPEKWVGHFSTETPIYRIALSKGQEGTAEALGEDRILRLYAFTPFSEIPNQNIFLVVGIPSNVAYAEVNRILTRNLLALGVVAVLALAATWGGGELFLLRPIRQLLEVTRRISRGDLAARTGIKSQEGELDQLACGFDRMAEALEQHENERRQVYEALQQEEQARTALLKQLITAQEDERRRIARELHDETSQSLTALMMGLDTARLALTDQAGKADAHLQSTRLIAEGMLDGIHRLIGDLRPSLLDDLGLVPAIAWYGERRLQPLGIRFNIKRDSFDDRLPREIETALFRIVQEALTNVVRHSSATLVELEVTRRQDCLILQLSDDGKGFDPSAAISGSEGKGFGLRGIQERVSILGGEFRLQTRPGAGTTITVQVPFRKGEMLDV